MKNIFLAPRSSETSYENFESTIAAGRSYSYLEPYLNEQEKSVLSKFKEISIWGNKESLKNRWRYMQPGDYVLFYAHGVFNYSARVVLTKYSKELGEKLWPYDEDGEPWPCLFFVDNLQEINIPLKSVQELAKYKPTWDRVQGFMKLNKIGHQAITEKFGSIDAFLKQTPALDQIIENVLENEKDEIVEGEIESEVDKNEILKEALSYKDSGASHVMNTTPRKVRIENRGQKKRVAVLENYSCQLCNWSLEWTNSKGKKSFRIDIDHIVDKAIGGGEEISNLWALCPNCHVKKTLGVIKVDLKNYKITDGGKEIKLLHDGHLKWDRK